MPRNLRLTCKPKVKFQLCVWGLNTASRLASPHRKKIKDADIKYEDDFFLKILKQLKI